MSELYLVAHKVNGEPAFDIAERMECPECGGHGNKLVAQESDYCEQIDCLECESLGFWWIIPTSGHRAYPFENWKLFDICTITMPIEMPDPWPDHYTHTASPTVIRDRLAALLAQLPPPKPFKRRF